MIAALPANMRNKIRIGQCQEPGVDGYCWTWTGAVTSSGYGSVAHAGRTQSTHCVSYELLIDNIPAGLTIDHLCLNKLCCNPVHLEAVTGLENTRRGLASRGYRRRDQPLPKRPPEHIARDLAMWDEFFGFLDVRQGSEALACAGEAAS